MNTGIMSRESFIRSLLQAKLPALPEGVLTSSLSSESLKNLLPAIFDAILQTAQADISGLSGYGEFAADNTLPNDTCEAFIRDNFADDAEGYWYHWRELFQTGLLREDFFERCLAKSLQYAPYCERHRYLANAFAYFGNMVTDGRQVAFLGWERAGVMDFLMDVVSMDLHKPYLCVPERFWQYAQAKGLALPDFRERYLCLAFFRGIDSLRWHASIDDEESCLSITQYLNGIERRILRIGAGT